MDDLDDINFDDYNFEISGAPQLGTTTFKDITSTNNPFDTPFGSNLFDTPFGDTETEETAQKAKARKLDEALLLEPQGLHLLRNETRHLQFQGKNHEAEDLNRLMSYYEVWSDKLFAKHKFSQFAKNIGSKTKGKRVNALLTEWQDEYNEKMQVRRDLHTGLSGETVGDEEGNIQQASSDEDDNRPLFFPVSAELSQRLQKEKKLPKLKKSKNRSSNYINSDEEDDDDLIVTKKPRTITFSDDEEEQPKPTSAKSGREYALSILAEKRKQRQLALRKKEEAEKAKEYDEVELAISDSELAKLNIPATTETVKETESAKDDGDFDVVEMVDIGELY